MQTVQFLLNWKFSRILAHCALFEIQIDVEVSHFLILLHKSVETNLKFGDSFFIAALTLHSELIIMRKVLHDYYTKGLKNQQFFFFDPFEKIPKRNQISRVLSLFPNLNSLQSNKIFLRRNHHNICQRPWNKDESIWPIFRLTCAVVNILRPFWLKKISKFLHEILWP